MKSYGGFGVGYFASDVTAYLIASISLRFSRLPSTFHHLHQTAKHQSTFASGNTSPSETSSICTTLRPKAPTRKRTGYLFACLPHLLFIDTIMFKYERDIDFLCWWCCANNPLGKQEGEESFDLQRYEKQIQV